MQLAGGVYRYAHNYTVKVVHFKQIKYNVEYHRLSFRGLICLVASALWRTFEAE